MNKKKETHLKVADSLDKPRSNSVFKRRAKDTIKIAGATIVGLMLLGNANKTYGQPKVKQGTELSGNQNKLGWGELKAKFGPAEKKMPNVYGPEYYKIILVDGVIIIGDGLLPLDYAKKDDVHASSKAHATETEVVEAHFTKVNGIPVCYKIFNDGILGIALRYDGKNLYTQQAYAGKDGDELIGNTYIAPNGTVFNSTADALVIIKPSDKVGVYIEPNSIFYSRGVFSGDVPLLKGSVHIGKGASDDIVEVYSPTMGSYHIEINANTLKCKTGVPNVPGKYAAL